MNDIKFSIMTPVYKVEEYLDECVQSVLNQSYENFELILVDDGSPDRSGEMCDAWAEKDSRIKVYHKPNGGALHSREYGIKHADGDYYMFLDSDDSLKGDCLEQLYGIIKAQACDCILFGYEIVSDGKVIECSPLHSDIYDRILCDKRAVLNLLLNDGSYNALWRKCIRSACFVPMDLTEYYSIRHGEDLIHSLCILKQADSFLFIGNRFYNYRLNRQSVTKSIRYDEMIPDFTVDRIVDEIAKQSGVFQPEDYDRLRGTRLFKLSVELRRIARNCSSDEKAISVMEKFRADEYVDHIISAGFHPVPESIGLHAPGFIKSLMIRSDIFLFRTRRYQSFIRLDRLLNRLLGR